METVRKHSKKRDAILSCLRNTTSHPTAEDIYMALKPEHPDLSLGTVYRNLSLFKEEATVISMTDIAGVEHFDATLTDHCHFFCTRCGAVSDVPAPAAFPELVADAETASGGKVLKSVIKFYGICKKCRDMEEK